MKTDTVEPNYTAAELANMVRFHGQTVAILERCESAFVRLVQLAEAYMNQGKQWSRIDANGIIAEMYACAVPVTEVRNVLGKIRK